MFFGLDNNFNIPYAGNHIWLGPGIGYGKAYKANSNLIFKITNKNITPDFYKHNDGKW